MDNNKKISAYNHYITAKSIFMLGNPNRYEEALSNAKKAKELGLKTNELNCLIASIEFVLDENNYNLNK